MKLLVVACLVAVAAGFPQNFDTTIFSGQTQSSGSLQNPTPLQNQVQSNPIPSVKTQGPTGGANTKPVNPYGPKAYGMGLNNPYAFPPNPFMMNRALSLANAHQGILVRVDVDGDVTLTDQYGAEVEHLYDNFGRDLTELYDL